MIPGWVSLIVGIVLVPIAVVLCTLLGLANAPEDLNDVCPDEVEP